jgi:hypothetical protein
VVLVEDASVMLESWRDLDKVENKYEMYDMKIERNKLNERDTKEIREVEI